MGNFDHKGLIQDINESLGPFRKSQSEAMAGFELAADPLWQGAGWRARLALREQLIATEVLAGRRCDDEAALRDAARKLKPRSPPARCRSSAPRWCCRCRS